MSLGKDEIIETQSKEGGDNWGQVVPASKLEVGESIDSRSLESVAASVPSCPQAIAPRKQSSYCQLLDMMMSA
ncbi:hypothetical protein [Scytonema sp. PCC 10023]|uniref:hypothetical protein n=1 Tax=Scytonema sp. PCC 10023 TaxID=1680591 RepID=UPI0039C5D4B5